MVVASVLSQYSGDVGFRFYQVRDGDGNIREGDIVDAIQTAQHRDNVDVINLSIGIDHISKSWKSCTEDGQNCLLCETVAKVIDKGVSVVAGAGNHPKFESVGCPSIGDETVSVAGCVAKCTGVEEMETRPGLPNRTVNPPGSYWVEREDDAGAQGIYCGGEICKPEIECSENQRLESWEHNVPSMGGKPDTFAPVHFASGDDDNQIIIEGTSYSTPIVSGQIANFISAFRDADIDVTPEEIRRGILHTGRYLEEGNGLVFSARDSFNHIGDPYDIGWEEEGGYESEGSGVGL
jgi:subtilisin family serine protease